MRRIFLFLVLLGLVLLGAGFLALGAFPPPPHIQSIEKVLPNSQFQSRG
jgi:hypothetical protein